VPGYFDTDMTREGAGAYKIEFALKYGPLGRPGAITELAKTALFLLSEEASYINGEAINITGGLNWIP
jgi:3-oxoacyl-[acyl-carrier protein] reductase